MRNTILSCVFHKKQSALITKEKPSYMSVTNYTEVKSKKSN